MEKVLQEYWLIIEHMVSGKGGLANGGVRLENGNYPTLRLFFVQCGVDCA